MEISILILTERVAGDVPAVLHVFLLAGVGEIAAAGRAPHREPSDRSAWNVIEILVDDLGFVTRDGLSGDARSSIVKTAADEHMQHFRRAYTVEDRHAGALRPSFVDGTGKRLACGHGHAKRRKIGSLLHRGEHRAIGGWCREADSRLVGFDDLDEVRR